MTNRLNEMTPARMLTGSEGHRKDVEGLRAIAVATVILFHAGVPFMAGGYVGVDVFFVISGFLITGLIVREMERSNSVDLVRFYARRIRRLLPASVVTLIAVAVIAFLVLPITRWSLIAGDISWSSLYAVNWRFAGQAVDYLAADVAPSPVQHFWSLAVEEQFYLFWPFLLLGVTAARRKQNRPLRASLLIGLAAVAVPSLVWSVYLTYTDPGTAYFVTTTRVWELAIGGGLAILAPQLASISRWLAEVLATLGLTGIVIAAITYGPATLFPGYSAALPVLATAAVIAAGIAHPDTFAGRLISLRPFVFVGGFSYALYLWHWPVLVAAEAQWGPLSPFVTTVAVAFAVGLSYLSYTWVEQPIRRSAVIITPPTRGLIVGLVLTMTGVAAALWLHNAIPEVNPPRASAATTTTTSTTQPGSETNAPGASEAPGAGVAPDTPTTTEAPVGGPLLSIQEVATFITPDPLQARDDIPAVYGEGCHQDQRDPEPIHCAFGSTEGPLVVIVGDSHAAQWVPALRDLADQHAFRLRSYTKSACAFASVDFVVGEQNRPYDSCVEWNDLVMEELIELEPDLIVTSLSHRWKALDASGDVLPNAQAQALLADGLEATWGEVVAAGLELVVVDDTPRPGFDVPECVVENRDTLIECAFDREAAVSTNTAAKTAAERTGLLLIDVTDELCSADLCPAVIDDLLVWRDSHHLTATFARYLSATLESALTSLRAS